MANKYIKSRKDFLLEQDLSGDPAAASADGEQPMPAQAPKEPIFTFIFLDQNSPEFKKRAKFPDGSSEMSVESFSTKEKELKDWVEKNVIDSPEKAINNSVLKVRRDNLIDLVKGAKVNISDDDVPNIDKLKNAVSSDIFGKREADIIIVFTDADEPTTEDIDATFINYNSK